MTFIKRLSGILMSVSLLASSFIAADAEEIYNGDFLNRKYTLCTSQSVTVQQAENFTQLTDDPLPGKTEISFAFSGDSDSKVRILAQQFNSEKSLCVLSLVMNESESGFSLSCVNALKNTELISDSLETGRLYCAVVQLDLKESLYNIALYEGSEKNRLIQYKRGISTGERCNLYGFTGVGFEEIDVSDFSVYREKLADSSPVIDMENEIATVGFNISDSITAGDAYNVYVAFYSDDRSALLAVEQKEYIHKGYDTYAEAVFPLSENFKSTCPVSVCVFRNEDIYPVSQSASVNISNGSVVYDNSLAYTGLEADEQYNSSSSVSGGKLPSGWYAQGWEGPTTPYNIAIESTADGESYLTLDAVEKGYMGIRCAGVLLPENGISVSFRVKHSEDYAGNCPRIVFLYFSESGSFTGASYSLYRDAVSYSWKKGNIYISPEDYPEGAAKVSVAFCTTNTSDTYGGKLYYDSLCIDNLTFNMECTEKLSWYSMGDTVTYKPKYPLCDKISEIYGSVYNSDGVLTDEVSADADDVAENGWSYTPRRSGFYKVIFHARTTDNRTVFEHASYKAYYESSAGKIHYIDRASHDFYITGFENKSMSNRNKLFGMSIDNYDGEYDLGIADKLGMSFVRLHAFSWKDIEPEDVTADNGKEYAWEKYDKIFDAVRNTDLNFDVIGNILYTPKWASPSDDESGMKPIYSGYAPTDMTYLTDFIKDLYARYGDAIDTWEIYNEPHLPSSGGSVFWHDTPDNYVTMLSNAYSTLKALSGGEDTVFMGGIGAKRYLSFYREFVEKGGWQYTDKLVMHGYDLDPWNYLAVNSNLGLDSDKGVVNTEAHMILFNGSSENIYYTEKQLALRMFTEYFRQIKYGVEQIAYFQPYDNSVQAEDLMILDNISSERDVVTAGIFRKKPSYQPRFAAGALNTLISMSGNSISYSDEYKTGNVNIVKFESDGKPLYVLWGDNLSDMSDDADIGELGENVKITDWEGRETDVQNFSVCADEVYFITGLSEDAFSHLDSAKGENVYSGAVLYSENEMNKKEVNGPSAVASETELFEHDTESVNYDSSGVVWNELTLSSGTDLKGGFAVNACDDGLDFVVKMKNSSGSDLAKALMVVGIDTFANGIQMDVVEISSSMQESGCTVTKTKAPDIAGDLPSDDYSSAGETVNGAKAFVSDGSDYSFYCIHIPFTQLYPYFYSEDGSVNFGLKFVGYSSSGSELTRYYHGNGYSTYKPWEFGTVSFDTEKTFDGLVDTEIAAEAGEYVTVQILKDGELVYFNQYVADSEGKCRITATLASEGSYVLRTYSNSIGYGTLDFKYVSAE